MMSADIPSTEPVPVAPETWLITNLAAAGPDRYLPVNSLLVRGREPVIVDTGAPIHRERWLDQVFSLVEPKDVRWIFLSHEDGDHTGGLADALAMCPSATLVTNFFATERLGLQHPLPLPRIFDGPTTRGLFDERTGVLWAVDSFAALTRAPCTTARTCRPTCTPTSFALLNSLISPWYQWLDPARYGRHVDSVAQLRPDTVATAHGPLLSGGAIGEAFDRVRAMAGVPRVMPPGQSAPEELIAAAVLDPVLDPAAA